MTLSSRDAIMRLPTGSTKPTNTSIYALRSAFCTTNKMGPTTGLEPINRVFSPLPMIASSCVFIALQYTRIGNVCKHFMCIFGKRREENHVQIVCKQGGCANFVQTKLTPESVQTCAKIWPAVARGWPVTSPGHRREGNAASGDSNPPAVKGDG